MISKQINKIINSIVNILAADEEIRKLLFFNQSEPPYDSLPDAQEIVDKGYIKKMPVHLQDTTKDATFITVNFDNAAVGTEVHVDAVKVAVATSNDNWITPDGDIRVLQIGERVEKLLDGKKMGQSTGNLVLSHIQEVYWNAFTTGYVYIFQIVEGRDNNALNI